MSRGQWPNRFIFILAAVGSAAGIGNLWRFPYLAYEYGGGAFVLAVIVANLLIGIPLLAAEVGLGQMQQKAAPDAWKQMKSGLKYLGWFTVTIGFFVLAYYMAVLAWGVAYLGASFTVAWGDDPSGFFFNRILNLSSGPDALGGVSWPVLAGMVAIWTFLYFSVWKGVESVSKVILWTATLPFVILAMLIVRAVSLEGAADGLRLFFIPQWTALLNPKLWMAAFSQVFFSLSLAGGLMIAYGSFKERGSEITKSIVWVAVGNFSVSIMSGVVVFGTLGYMALEQGVAISEVVQGGPSLAFVTFPMAITLMPAWNELIAVVFFVMLLTLGIDSAFSIFEAFATAFKDRFPNVSVKKITLIIATPCIVLSLLFTSGAGLYYLDIADHFLVNYGMVSVGLLEAIAIGWLLKSDALRVFVNQVSDWQFGRYWNLTLKFLIPGFLGFLLIYNLIDEIRQPYEGYALWALVWLGVFPVLAAPVIGALAERLTEKGSSVG
ncbi:MAG: sodium-dependent transporter [Arenicellales bacterium]